MTFSATPGDELTRQPVTLDGCTLPLAEWCQRLDIGLPTVRYRLKVGLTPEEALTTKRGRVYKLRQQKASGEDTQSGAAPKPTRFSVEEMAARRARGETLKQIGEALGCSHETVRLYLAGREDYHARQVFEKRSDGLKGQMFGRLTVVAPAPCRNGKYQVLCRCECGNECVVRRSHLASGQTASCGCAKGRATFVTIDGQTKNLRRWCEELSISYATVRKRLEMGVPPVEALTTPSQGLTRDKRRQRHETPRNAIHITLNGRTQCISHWCRETGITRAAFKWRVRSGWSIKDALLTPARQTPISKQ